MFLARAEVLHFPAEAYASVSAIQNAILARYSVGVSNETASRIISDWRSLPRDRQSGGD